MEKRERNTYATAIGISILLHLLLLFLIGVLNLLSPDLSAELQAAEHKPIVLEFEQPPPPPPPPAPPEEQQQLEEKLYEVVENPNADEQNPLDGNLLAASASRSAAPDNAAPGTAQAPRTEFELSNDVSLPNEASESAEPEPEETPDLDGKIETFLLQSQKRFSKKLLTQNKQIQDTQNANQTLQSETGFVQPDFEAEFVGELRFNTTAWDWAPWWLKFRDKLVRFWILNLPSMYNRLGLLEGRTYVTIRVNREGELMDYVVKKHIGHESLYQSSVGAVEGVFPFRELPPDFPEEFLEINFVMIYPNLRELAQKYPGKFGGR